MVVLDFKVNEDSHIDYVSYEGDKTVNDFIKDFLKDKNLYYTTDRKVYTFKTQGKILNTEKWLYSPLKEVINSDATIYFIKKQSTHYSK